MQLLCMMEYFLKMAWGLWTVDPKIFLHHFENWDKHWNTAFLWICPWRTVKQDAQHHEQWWCGGRWWRLICSILHIVSTIKQHQVNNSPVVSLLIVGIFCLFNPWYYWFQQPCNVFSILFPTRCHFAGAIHYIKQGKLVVWTRSQKIIIGTFWIVEPLQKNAMPKRLDSFNSNLIRSSYVDW